MHDFSVALKSGNLSGFEEIPFNRNVKDKTKLISQYTNLIYHKYLEYGEQILTGNFTEILKYFGGVMNPALYETFLSLQNDYNKSKILGQDFDENFRVQASMLGKDDSSLELNYE